MQGRKCFALSVVLLALAGCSSNSLLKADCHSCTVEEENWKEFAWGDLQGHWRGSLENLRNQKGVDKKKTDVVADFRFFTAADFLKTHGGSCEGLPLNAVVMNGMLWESGNTTKEYETFVPAEDGKVAYGRLAFEQLNGVPLCRFHRFGRVMGKNRLDLPSVAFSTSNGKGRNPATVVVPTTQEINVEFLRFVPTTAMKDFLADGRKPAAASEQERPPLMIRVFRVNSLDNGSRGEWTSTEEFIYRLWKAD